ncbi:MAG TPA: hypothetical protein VJR05_12920, partial [Acidimicrobiia bacterium]|nr:hypothetical protein [Acidimicrobiia bacterium]
RALSAVCEETCRLSSISREKALELYYQNPKFGFFLIRLVSGLVQEDMRNVHAGGSLQGPGEAPPGH